MPTSPSPRRGVKPRRQESPPAVAPARALWPRIALIGVLAVIAVVVIVLPASLANKFLPPAVRAEDFSGTLWHGSAGRISVAGRDAGALEWQLHPALPVEVTSRCGSALGQGRLRRGRGRRCEPQRLSGIGSARRRPDRRPLDVRRGARLARHRGSSHSQYLQPISQAPAPRYARPWARSMSRI